MALSSLVLSLTGELPDVREGVLQPVRQLEGVHIAQPVLAAVGWGIGVIDERNEGWGGFYKYISAAW